MKLVWHHPGMTHKESIRGLFADVVTNEVEDPEFNCFDDDTIHVVSVIFKPLRDMERYFARCRQICNNLVLYHAGDEWFSDRRTIYRYFDNVVREAAAFDLQTEGLALVPRVTSERDAHNPRAVSSQRALIWSCVGDLRTYPGPMMKQFSAVPHGKAVFVNTPHSLSRDEQLRMLGDTVFVPCTAETPDLQSQRLHDALEAGAIPLLRSGLLPGVAVKALGKHPLPEFRTWRGAAAFAGHMMDKETSLDSLQATVLTWWQGYKRTLASAVSDMLAVSHASNLMRISEASFAERSRSAGKPG